MASLVVRKQGFGAESDEDIPTNKHKPRMDLGVHA